MASINFCHYRWHHRFNGQELGWTRRRGGIGWDGEAWCPAVHGVAKSQTWLGNWTMTTFMVRQSLKTQFSSVTQSCPTICDPMKRSTPGLPVYHQLPESTQTHVHCVSDAIQPSHPLSSPSLPAPNRSQQQDLFIWVSSSHQVAKVLEFQLQHQSLQWTLRTDLL